jgi:hypothetical protein
MGWLFSERWLTRRALINEIVSPPADGGVIGKVLRHCCTGNNLWTLNEVVDSDSTTHRFITLYMLQKHGRTYTCWGYKDVEETCGPVVLTCPLSYLDACTEPANEWSREWRKKVRARHAALRQKLDPGQQFTFHGVRYYEIVRKVSDGYEVVALHGGTRHYLSRSQLPRIQLVEKEKVY